MQTITNVPINLAEWVLKNKKYKELELFIRIKNENCGVFHGNDLEEYVLVSKIKTQQTFNNRFKNIVDLGWIDYHPKTDLYITRSIYQIAQQLDNPSRSVMEIPLHAFNNDFQVLLFAGVLSSHVEKVRFYFTRVTEGRRLAREKGLGFEYFDFQEKKVKRFFGVGMKSIGKRLGISRQRANLLKKMAEKKGYIKCISRSMYLGVVDPTMCRKKELLGLPGSLQFRKGRDNKIKAYRILPDEILSTIRIKRRWVK